jgi:hypothetical protein
VQDLKNALEILDQQYAHYQTMYQISLEQRICIECEDLPRLDASFERMHRLTDQIRLRQAGMPDVGRDGKHLELQKRRGKLREIITELDELRQVNERAVKRLLERTRVELRQFGKGRRAIQKYQKTGVQDARFFDGTR